MLVRQTICIIVSLVLLACFCMPVQGALAADDGVKSAPMTYATNAQDGMVRVYLSSMGSRTSLNITVSGSYTAEGSRQVSLRSGDKVRIQFDSSSGNIAMVYGGTTYSMGRSMSFRRHQSEGKNGLRIAEARMPSNLYPGDLVLVAQKSGSAYKLYPIVHVYMEDYLTGVVPYEMGNGAPLEALKAQAVAARTYTLARMISRDKQLYDVVDTTNDQVYFGNSDATANCTAAVNATRGIVLMNGGELTGTYYTASNGGQTESAANLWGAKNMGYLMVKDDPFDRMNTASSTKTCVVYADHASARQPAALRRLISQKAESVIGSGAQVLTIDGITPHTAKYASPSRLYTKMDFQVTARLNGQKKQATLTFDIFSELEGALGMSINNSRNELWSVERSGDTFVITAARFGHGVGMSQRGAMKMGELGYTYDMILGFYYEGSIRVQCTFVNAILSPSGSVIKDTDTPAEITQSGDTAVVQLSSIDRRVGIMSSPSASGRVLTSLIHGSMVTVLARGESWTLVRLGDIVGYTPTECLRFGSNPPSSSHERASTVAGWARVQCSGKLNLRAQPTAEAEVRSMIPSGEVLSVFSVGDRWAHVQYGATSGYCSVDFLQMLDVYPYAVTLGGSMIATVKTESQSGVVNLRASASTTAEILATLRNGEQVTVLQSDGSWCRVQYGQQKGYIRADLISGGTVQAAPTETARPETAPVLPGTEQEAIVQTPSGTLNLREQPSDTSRVLTRLPRGESVVVTSRGEKWSAVRYGSQTGYVQTAYLRFMDDDAQGIRPIGWATVVTTRGSLNLRSQARAGSKVLMQIPQNARVAVLGVSGSWSQVLYAETTGYVLSSYLRMDSAVTPAPTTQSATWATVVTSDGSLNLRATPSSKGRKLTTIPQGTRLAIQKVEGQWALTSYQGAVGYVMTQYLTFDAQTTPDAERGASAWVASNLERGVRVRALPSTSAEIIMTLPASEPVLVIRYGDEWCSVQCGNLTGYIMTSFLTWEEPPQQPMVAWVSNAVNNGVHMRKLASDRSDILVTLMANEPVTVLHYGDEWSKVQWNNLVGYMMTQFLTFNPSSAQATLPAPTGEATVHDVAWVIDGLTSGLRLRAKASSKGEVLALLDSGTQLMVINRGSTWTQVRWNSLDGYVKTSYLRFEPEQTEAAESAVRIVRTDSGGLNLRLKPDRQSSVLAVLPQGSEVTLLEERNGWCKVTAQGKTGYVMSQYLALPGSGGGAPPSSGATYDPTLREVWGVLALVNMTTHMPLYTWCDESAPMLGYVPRGATVEVLEAGDTWSMMMYGGVSGYCLTSSLAWIN